MPFGRHIADFACHEARLVIEIDGGTHNKSLPGEIERTHFMEEQGYRVLRFWNNELLTTLDGVYDVVAAALQIPSPSMGEGREGAAPQAVAEITPTPTLPRRGGGGISAKSQ